MEELGVFDILGPVMVGPSSNHTGGACRIGWVARQVLGEEPLSVRMGFFGMTLAKSYRGHATDRAIIGGLLGMREDDLGLRGSLDIAAQHGMKIEVVPIPPPVPDNNIMRLDMVGADGQRRIVTGYSIGGGSIVLGDVDGFPLDLDGNGHVLLAECSRAQALPVMEAMSILSPGAGFSLIERNSLVPGTRQDNPPDTLLLLGILADRPEAMLLSKLNGMKGVAWARYVPPVRAFFRKKGVQTVPVTFAWMSEASELPLHERIIQREMERDGKSREEVRAEMARVYGVMKEAAELGLSGNVDLLGGFVSKDDAARLHELASGRTLAGSTLMKSASYALSVATVNAAMGRIVACPTGGASGLLPGVLLAVMDAGGFSLEEMIDAMFVAAGTGAAIGRLCSFSGSVGGCMAEIGFASAMAASAVAHLEGAGPRAVTHAAAMAMKSVLGLVCDPVGGPVEIPCIKRNAVLAGVALVAGEMAVAGIESAIPPDEVVDAAKDVQLRMPQCFKSTLDSSLAATRKGKELRQVWLERL